MLTYLHKLKFYGLTILFKFIPLFSSTYPIAGYAELEPRLSGVQSVITS